MTFDVVQSFVESYFRIFLLANTKSGETLKKVQRNFSSLSQEVSEKTVSCYPAFDAIILCFISLHRAQTVLEARCTSNMVKLLPIYSKSSKNLLIMASEIVSHDSVISDLFT